MAQTLDALLERGEGRHTAVAVPGGPQLTYAELRDEVARAASRLAGLGLGRGDRIALVVPNSAETILLFLAAARVGTAAPLNPAYKEDEFRFYLEDTGARALVVARGAGEAARAAVPAGTPVIEAALDAAGHIRLDATAADARAREPAAPDGDDVALVLHTSGTTSRPKQVPLRQRNLAYSAENIARTYSLGPDDV